MKSKTMNIKEKAFMEALAKLMEEHNVLMCANDSCIGFCVDRNIDNFITLPADEVFCGDEILDLINKTLNDIL